MRRFKIKLLNQKHILPGIFVILSFCMAEKPGRKEPAAQIQEPDQKKVALAILQAKCNTCHSVQNPRKVFTLENMSGLAPKIYQQVFVKKRMPRGAKNGLSRNEYDTLKQWLFTEKKFNNGTIN
jgi:uncharacterized membrane protein